MDALRIAHVTPYDLAARGGVNASVVELVRRQRELGHTVDLIGGASADREDVPAWRRISSTIVRVPANGAVAALAIPLGAGPDGEIAQLLADQGYDVIVVHEPALPLGVAVLGSATTATIGVMHAYSESVPFPPYLGMLTAAFVRRPDRLIAVSTAAREFASRYLDLPYAIIPNGIDVPRNIDRRPAAPPQILFLGRPEPRKGLHVLLDAFALVRHHLPSVRLVIAGDGSDEQWSIYRAQARALGIASVTEFRGRVTEAEKRELFRRATLYVSPATGGESQGVVLLEAMAQATPVVASDIAGYRTVVTPEVNGLLAAANDPTSLTDAIRRVLTDAALAARLAAGGRSVVEREYDWRVVIPRHLGEYRAAMRGHRKIAA